MWRFIRLEGLLTVESLTEQLTRGELRLTVARKEVGSAEPGPCLASGREGRNTSDLVGQERRYLETNVAGESGRVKCQPVVRVV